jgi:DNA polymerase III delta prime subunit
MAVNSLFVEKYRPSTLDLYVGDEELKAFVQACIDNNYIPHLLLHGIQGTGKTTLAKMLVNTLNCDYIYINASDERNIDTVRDKIVSFASTNSFSPLKIVILDEADFLTPVAMAALRSVMEQFSAKTRFILTCNYVEKIIDPLISRCQTFSINPPKKIDLLKHICLNILDKEEINYSRGDVATIIKKHFPDIRKIINVCQSLIVDKNLIYSDLSKIPASLSNILIDKLKNTNKDTWLEIRKEVIYQQVKEFQPIYSDLFSRMGEYSKGQDGLLAIILNNYQKNNPVVVDKELNFAACMAEILKII